MQNSRLARQLAEGVEKFLLLYETKNQIRDGIRTLLGNHLSMHGLANINRICGFREFLFTSKKVIFINPHTIGTRNYSTDVVFQLNPKYEIKSILPIDVRSRILLKYTGVNFFFLAQFRELQHGCGVVLIGQDHAETIIPFDGKCHQLNGNLNNILVRSMIGPKYSR